MSTMVIANVFGIFILFFLLWKTLRDDYSYEKIFNLGFLIVFGFVLGLISSKIFNFSYYLAKDFSFWIILFGVTSGFIFGILKQKMNFFDSFEGFVVGNLSWVGLIFISDAVSKSSLSSFLAFWMSLICIFLFFFLNTVYKNFTWYKSGRVGFSGIFTALVFFLIRIITTFIFPDMISLAGKLEIYLSGSAALLFIVLLYNLSRKEE